MDALILSCGTGGGHNTAAYAIKEELLRRGNHAVMINPYLLHSQKLADRINRAYVSIAQNIPACFGAIYNLGEAYRRLPCKSPIYYSNAKMVPLMEEYLNRNNFDVVIMTHLFPAEIMTQMKDRGIKIPKTILIATDYTCIPFTEDTDCDAYIIPAEELCHEFQSRGIPREKIFPLGIPVRAEFTMQISKKEARKILGLAADKKYLLISGGSIRAGSLKRTIELLHRQCTNDTRIIVICGNNTRLYNSLVEKYGDVMEIVQGTEQMAIYLRASDLYFSKPGGLSSTEAAVMGVPLIHLPPIPGCETKNAHFFCAYGMNYRIDATRQNVLQALALITDTPKCSEMIQKQQKMIRRNSASSICDFAESLMDKVL